MTNHAVLTVWTLDNHNFDPVERDKLLTEEGGAAGEHAAGLRRRPVEPVIRRRPRVQHRGLRRSGSGRGVRRVCPR